MISIDKKNNAVMQSFFENARKEMVVRQLRRRGIKNERVLRTMGSIPRELFVPEDKQSEAYQDAPIFIGHDQTISQPYVAARMLELLAANREEKILEIGTGSGYLAAVLGRLAKHVYSLEVVKDLAVTAKRTLDSFGYHNVTIVKTNARQGYPERAPYDGIISSAASADIPQAWKDQLCLGGRIVAPVGDANNQRIIRITRYDTGFIEKEFEIVAFVPLVNET